MSGRGDSTASSRWSPAARPGIGLATPSELPRPGRTVAVLDLEPRRLPPEPTGPARRHRPGGRRRDRGGARRGLGGIDIVVNNAGISAVGTVEETRRRLGARARHQRGRHGACERAPPCRGCGARDGRRSSTSARSPPSTGCRSARLLGVEGRGPVADPRDGHRPRPRGHPRQLREPRHGRTPPSSTGCCRASTIPSPSARPSTRARRPAGWSRPTRSPAPSSTSPAPLGLHDRHRPRRRRRRDTPADQAGPGCGHLARWCGWLAASVADRCESKGCHTCALA